MPARALLPRRCDIFAVRFLGVVSVAQGACVANKSACAASGRLNPGQPGQLCWPDFCCTIVSTIWEGELRSRLSHLGSREPAEVIARERVVEPHPGIINTEARHPQTRATMPMPARKAAFRLSVFYCSVWTFSGQTLAQPEFRFSALFARWRKNAESGIPAGREFGVEKLISDQACAQTAPIPSKTRKCGSVRFRASAFPVWHRYC
jgi:hypothetical protein